MRYVALICARGGSKGLPGKNTRPLAGKPLIAWAIESARAHDAVARVIVSTDSHEIAEVARHSGAEVPFLRPAELARDDSPEWLVWQHALRWLDSHDPERVDGLLVLPVTAPLRSASDIDRCLELYEAGDADVVITASQPHRNPYFNMISLDDEGYARVVIEPAREVAGRQQAPAVLDITTVAYVANPAFVARASRLFDGRVRAVEVPVDRSIDIDTQLDFDIAQFLMKRRLEQGYE